MKDMLREIWEICGTINNAIENHDIQLFNNARDKFLNIYKNKFYLNSLACATAGRVYQNNEEMDFDRESNYAKLAFDLEYSRNEVLQKEFNGARTIQFISPIEVLWFTRIMYDELISSVKNGNISREKADEDFKIIIDNLDETLMVYKDLNDKVHIKERITLHMIKQEICAEYYNLYVDEYTESR